MQSKSKAKANTNNTEQLRYEKQLSKYFEKIEKQAIKKARSHQFARYQACRKKIMGKAMRMTWLSKSERMRLTHTEVGCGGLLPFARDEFFLDCKITSLEDLRPLIDIFDEGETSVLFEKWRNEAAIGLNFPDPPIESVEDSVNEIEGYQFDSILNKKRRLVDTSILNYD